MYSASKLSPSSVALHIARSRRLLSDLLDNEARISCWHYFKAYVFTSFIPFSLSLTVITRVFFLQILRLLFLLPYHTIQPRAFSLLISIMWLTSFPCFLERLEESIQSMLNIRDEELCGCCDCLSCNTPKVLDIANCGNHWRHFLRILIYVPKQ